jgi:NAD(P)-dependent dehydrogenase (short-subunit alcohol dehydrogenase family)
VSKVAHIERLFAAAVEHFGRLDIVVANAGVGLTSSHRDQMRERRVQEDIVKVTPCYRSRSDC